MNNATFFQLKETISKVKRFPINKLVFWVGSGIDSANPTAMPLGSELMKHLLSLSLGSYANILLGQWRKNAEVISTVAGNLLIPNDPRLETIIECIREFESKQKKDVVSVIKCLKAFSSSDILPNHEHYVLAYLLHEGANLVTTNYSDFICRAYKELYGKESLEHEKQGLHYYKTKNALSTCIYHLHGISDDLKTIGANLSSVKNSLPLFFREKFNGWLNAGYCIIYLGYSGLDTLDVNSYLQTCSDSNDATGIYIRHTSNDAEKIRSFTGRERILLSPFGHKNICSCLTSDFLKGLKVFADKDPCHKSTSLSDWKTEMDKHAVAFTEDYSYSLLLIICYMLGINITTILPQHEWLRKTSRCKNIISEYRTFYSFEASSMLDDCRLTKGLGKEYKTSQIPLDRMNYYAAIFKMPRSAKYAMTPLEIEKGIKTQLLNNEIIDWNISTSITYRVASLAYRVTRYPLLSKIELKRLRCQKDTSILLECNKSIIQIGNDGVLNVSQIFNAYSALAMCYCLSGSDFTNAEKYADDALNFFADVNSIRDVTMAFINIAKIQLFEYLFTKDDILLEKSKKNIDCAKQIIYKCGALRYKSELRQLIILYEYCKVFIRKK